MSVKTIDTHQIINQHARVTVSQFFKEGRERLKLEMLAGKRGINRVLTEPLLHRPGLALTGFYEHFAWERVQTIGMAEYGYLSSLPEALRKQRVHELFAMNIPCMVFTRGLEVFPEILVVAEHLGIPVMKSEMLTREFLRAGTFLLEELDAPRCKVYGTMVEVSGVGVFIEGAPGLGKSETALGLIKRGHALVADDLTEFRRDSNGRLIASALNVTKFFMEIRGIGIIYVPAIFGVTAVRGEKHVDLVITLMRQADVDAELDRTGTEELYREFLGIRVPQRIVPVAPGRDLVNLVETAAQEYKLRMTGYVAVSELDARIKKQHGATGSKVNGTI
jgi:HPr kinase/phosphorylase